MDISRLSSPSSVNSSGSREPRLSPQALFKTLDTDNKGYLTQTEFESAEPKISARGAQLAAQDRPTTSQIFAKLDADQDGKLTSSEFEAGAPDVARKSPPPQGPGGPGGAPGGPKGPPPPPRDDAASGESQEASAASSSSFDAADANQDGSVSAVEQLVYDTKNAVDPEQSAPSSTATQQAIRSYQRVGELAA